MEILPVVMPSFTPAFFSSRTKVAEVHDLLHFTCDGRRSSAIVLRVAPICTIRRCRCILGSTGPWNGPETFTLAQVYVFFCSTGCLINLDYCNSPTCNTAHFIVQNTTTLERLSE